MLECIFFKKKVIFNHLGCEKFILNYTTWMWQAEVDEFQNMKSHRYKVNVDMDDRL